MLAKLTFFLSRHEYAPSINNLLYSLGTLFSVLSNAKRAIHREDFLLLACRASDEI